MQVIVPSHGPVPARVLVIGEHPSVDDERKLKLFSGLSGDEFKKMLHEAGFLISEIRFTSLIKFRPYANQMKYVWTRESKEANDCIKGYIKIGKGSEAVFHHPDFRMYISHIEQEILQTRPNVIITLGDAALWALTSTVSVNKWRGSLLETAGGTKVIPTYSPSQIMRMWEWRAHAVRDLERARFESNFPEVRAPSYKFYIRPTFQEARSRLKYFLHLASTRPTPLRLTADLETIARHIACIGFAWSKTEGMCIPFMSEHHTHFYSLDEEVELVLLIKEVTTHPNIYLIWQNGAYDIQHFVRHWGFRPNHNYDTLLGQHILFPGIPKDLGFQASMYCSHYVYWKDELTDYKKLPKDLDKFWAYNAKDCCHTYEIAEVTEELINRLGFVPQREFIHRVNNHVITMMIRGVRINKDEKSRLGTLLGPEIDFRQMRINEYVGQELNISSPKQMTQFFYDDLKLKPVLHKKTKRPTADKDALPIFAQREPILKPIVDLIAEARSIGVFYSTFVMMKLDKDGRMRTSYNVGGTETYRFSSSKNAFDSGGNMQNWPKGDEEEEHRPDEFVFPNVRRMVIPDPSMILFDVDLAGADAQIVAWEAEDDDLKAKFRSGAKIHALNAKDMYGASAGPDGKTPPYYKKAKMGCHLTNYGGTPSTLAKSCGMTMHEAELFQRRWFAMHPGIKTWHEETLNSLMTTRSVRNKFGFRRYYFDRIDGILPQALAWIPQSTVAIVINHGLCNIAESGSSMELLMQVHDSLVGQMPKSDQYLNYPILHRCLSVTVPYTDPLVIGTSLDVSKQSWGDLVSLAWHDVLDAENASKIAY